MINQIPPEILQGLLIAVGALFLMNLGSIATMFLSSFKIGRWVGKMEAADKEIRGLAVQAHKRINKLTNEREEE